MHIDERSEQQYRLGNEVVKYPQHYNKDVAWAVKVHDIWQK